MKNNQPPQAARHAITTARRPDNTCSSAMVRSRSTKFMARPSHEPRSRCSEIGFTFVLFSRRFIYVYIHIYIHICTYMYMYIHTCTYIHIHICTYWCTFRSKCTYIFTCMVCIYTSIYFCAAFQEIPAPPPRAVYRNSVKNMIYMDSYIYVCAHMLAYTSM